MLSLDSVNWADGTTLPASLNQLTNLTTLEISWNWVKGTANIGMIGDLPNLSNLILLEDLLLRSQRLTINMTNQDYLFSLPNLKSVAIYDETSFVGSINYDSVASE